MKNTKLYPWFPWLVWVVLLPMLLLGIGVGLLATTKIGNLPFDNLKLWWLGAAVPLASVLLVYSYYRRRRLLVRFASDGLATSLAARVSPVREAISAFLFATALLAIVAAVLGPRWGKHIEKQKVHGVDVVVALDVSRSMLATDLSPNRLEYAKTQIRQQLIERAVFRRANRLALMAFAGSTSLRVPLTTDHLAFQSQLDRIGYGSAPRGGTAIGEAIIAAADLFRTSPPDATKVVLLITDGENHEGKPVEAAKTAFEKDGIHVYTVAVGDLARSVGAQVPVSGGSSGKPLLYDDQIVFSRVDTSGLKEIAQAGGGAYASITDLHVLVNAIASLWETELATEEHERYKPRYQWFLAVALALLTLEAMMPKHRPGQAAMPMRSWQLETAK